MALQDSWEIPIKVRSKQTAGVSHRIISMALASTSITIIVEQLFTLAMCFLLWIACIYQCDRQVGSRY